MYVKLFTSIYQGTLRGNSDGLLVFTNLLAHADVHGVADIHPSAISDEVGLPIERVRETLIMLESPDIESRSPENDGRRIVRLDGHRAWGWQIVNYVKYRAIKNEDDRREQNREAQARFREKNKQPSAIVSTVSPGKPMQKQREMQIQKDIEEPVAGERRTAPRGPTTAAKRRQQLPADFYPDATGLHKASEKGLSVAIELTKFTDFHKGKGSVMADWQAAWRTWIGNAATFARPAFNAQLPLTVPAKPGIDPALAQLTANALKAVAPPPAIRARMKELSK